MGKTLCIEDVAAQIYWASTNHKSGVHASRCLKPGEHLAGTGKAR